MEVLFCIKQAPNIVCRRLASAEGDGIHFNNVLSICSPPIKKRIPIQESVLYFFEMLLIL